MRMPISSVRAVRTASIAESVGDEAERIELDQDVEGDEAVDVEESSRQ